MKDFINEFQPNPTGADPANVSIELKGTPGEAFTGTLLSIESDPSGPGTVDRVSPVSGTYDANGLLVVTIADLENPSFTFVLVDSFTGQVGDDLDINDDGIADADLAALGVTVVYDAIGIADSTEDEAFLYGLQLGGTDMVFSGDEPRLVFRDGETGALYAVNDPDNGEVIAADGTVVAVADFDIDPTDGTDTFGAVNPTVGADPAPGDSFSLQVTEMWPGNADNPDLTEDWFELTNTGTAAWVAATDGDLYFDDESASAIDADLLSGIETIAAGETVIFVDGDVAEFKAVWAPVIDLTGVQIGTYAGAGLGGGGDAVNIFIEGNEVLGDGTLGDAVLLSSEAYPETDAFPGQSYDVTMQQFSGDLADQSGVATTAPNTAGESAVGSPGNGAPITDVTPPAEADFTLSLLHFTDQEANAATIDNIDNLSAVLNALRDEDVGADGTLTLSSGDAIIPGLFFDASAAVFGTEGIADIQIQNELGVQAIALGNHEFDLGTGLLASLIDGSATGDFSALLGSSLEGLDFAGTDFPYLSANLGFDTDPNLAPLAVDGGLAPSGNVVTSSVVIDTPAEGANLGDAAEKIAVIGATVPTIGSISSPGADLGIFPGDFDSVPTPEQLDALAAEIQAEVDAVLAANPDLNKVILLSHMQQISIEQSLAARLEGVDVIVAGGSNTRLFDEDDRVRDGDSDQGTYPIFVENAGGTTTAVVNTDGNYKYVGRLVIDFDADGNIIADSYDATVSGAYATDDQGVADLGAETLVDAEIDAITDAIQAEIVATESNVFGVSDVFLNGNRSGTFAADDPDGVRTQETNLGNLTADANLEYAKDFDDSVVISIKNGGGIRANIGEIIVPAGGTEAVRTPNAAVIDENGNVVKPEGGISQNDIGTVLAFNNDLVLVDITREELVATLEGGVSALPNVDGGFVQVSGVKFAFDETLPAGDRIISAGVFDADGTLIAELVRDGEIVGDPQESFRVVTLNFLVDFGDPILSQLNNLSNPNRVDLTDLDADGVADEAFTGAATFTEDGTEQDALAEYLNDNFNPDNGGTAFADADTGPDADDRIQNLTFQDDTVFGDAEPEPEEPAALTFAVANAFQGEGGDGASEVVAHEDGKLYVTNGNQGRIDIFDLSAADGALSFVDLTTLEGFDSLQSVAVSNGVVAAAISRPPAEQVVFGQTVLLSQPGFVAMYDTATLALISTVDVGNLPDQLTFNADGTTLLVAGEGEKNADSDHGDNPLGTVAVIDVSDPANPVAEILDATQFNGFEDLAREAGIRIQEGVSIAEDIEPEYIAVSPDGTTAFVSLQENNAIGKLDLTTGEIIDIFGLGVRDFSLTGFDPLDDGNIDIRTVDNVVGFRMPDAIAATEIAGETYVLTANEGDSRDFDEARVESLVNDGALDLALVADLLAKGLIDEDPNTDVGIERLEVSSIDGDTDGDGDIDVIHAFSSRSFSIFDADGNLVFDSGSEFEEILAEIAPERFNDDDGQDDEDRSDAKGPEPEAIETGKIDGVLYAFIGLERDSGIMIYNIDDPANASFVTYIPPSHVDNTADGDLAKHAPEVIEFIAAEDSLTGKAQIAVSYEVSGTTVVYDLASPEEPTRIFDIQGAGHVSAFVGETVTTSGIVTAVDFNGYYLQDPEGDDDDATSDGIFVFVGNGNASAIAVGDEVRVTGAVSEFIPGGAGTGNLSITQISDFNAEQSQVVSSGNALPSAVILGVAGRTPPTEVVISPDETPVNLQDDPGVFNPEVDGIDFYESLEGMLVTVDNPVAISATNRFDETWVVADDGTGVTGGNPSGGLNDRGALIINADVDGLGDLNPERIQIQYDAFFDLLPEGFTPPNINLGDDLSDVTGVVGYAFGNFEINVTAEFTIETPTANTAEVTEIAAADDTLTVATYNILNVTANEADGDADQIATLGAHIAGNLNSPDIVALQEIQDDSGVTDDGTLNADATLQAIVDAIVAAGGPEYRFESAVVDVDGENGGVPGGNIRNAYLYNPDRVEAVGFTTLESDVLAEFGVTNPDAFEGTRDPLLGTFAFNGEEVTLINNHFSSRFGSEPIFGGPQPFNQGGEDAREQQALAINEVVDAILNEDAEARVSVLGDLNTFEFTDELAEDLPGIGEEQVLTNLVDSLTEDDAYTFVFQGNAQMLDHIFATDSLLDGAAVDVVHVNNDFAVFASDHEPIVASFIIPEAAEPEPAENMVLFGRDGDDVLVGDSGDDRLRGRDGNDDLSGRAGNDLLQAGDGNDALDGGEGDDRLFGNDGDDMLFGGDGDDLLRGGDGQDTLEGGAGNDVIRGDDGADTFLFYGDFGEDIVKTFDAAEDTLAFGDITLADVSIAREGNTAVVTVSGVNTFGRIDLLNAAELNDDVFVFI